MYAAISVDIKQDVREVERMLKGLKNGAPKVLTRALNKTIRPVRTAAVRSLARDLRISQKEVRGSLNISRAYWHNMNAYVGVVGTRLPIMALGARQTKKGVTYKGRAGGRSLIPSAFISTMPSGHTGVFSRFGDKVEMSRGRYAGTGIWRQQIEELHGASIPYVFLKRHILKAMDTVADERWRKNLDHEIKWFIQNA